MSFHLLIQISSHLMNGPEHIRKSTRKGHAQIAQTFTILLGATPVPSPSGPALRTKGCRHRVPTGNQTRSSHRLSEDKPSVMKDPFHLIPTGLGNLF